MRTFLFLSMLLVASTVGAQNKLTVTVDGIGNSKGKILVAVFDSINFLKQPVYSGLVDVKQGQEEATIVIDSIASGKYAVSLFLDENGNYKVDTGAYGIPVEKFGFSNNVRPTMGAPTFQDCMFTIKEDTEINITLQ